MRFIIGLIFELLFGFENKWSKLVFFPPKWKNPETNLSIEDRRRIGRGIKHFREKRNQSLEEFASRAPMGPHRLKDIESGESAATDQELAFLVKASGEFIPQLYHYEIPDLEHRTFAEKSLREKSRKIFNRGKNIHYRVMGISQRLFKMKYPKYVRATDFCHDCTC